MTFVHMEYNISQVAIHQAMTFTEVAYSQAQSGL